MMKRKSIREWIPDAEHDYAVIQRQFLLMPLTRYCRFLESVHMDGFYRKVYEDAQALTGADESMTTGKLFVALEKIVRENAGSEDGTLEAERYDGAMELLRNLIIKPFYRTSEARRVARKEIDEKIEKRMNLQKGENHNV